MMVQVLPQYHGHGQLRRASASGFSVANAARPVTTVTAGDTPSLLTFSIGNLGKSTGCGTVQIVHIRKKTPWASQDIPGYPSIGLVDWDNPG